MSPLNKPRIGLLGAGVFFTVVCASSMAGLPEPMDPHHAVKLSIAKRLAYARELREAMASASPEERRDFRQALHRKMELYSREQRKAIHDQMHLEWKKLSKEEKDGLRLERKLMMATLSREEKKEIREQRRKAKELLKAQ